MELTATYIISQILIIITYTLLVITYCIKNRAVTIILSFLSIITEATSYILLNAHAGLAMCGVAFVRNIIFIADEKINGKRAQIYKKDVAILALLYIVSIVLAIYTYNGFQSLPPVFATMLYTYSLWQRKSIIYKLFGVPIGILYILYGFYIKSFFTVVLETILLISAIIGYIQELKKSSTNGDSSVWQ